MDNIPTILNEFDEPFADSSAIPSMYLNKKAKSDVTVVLSGDGGDESFFGYNHFFISNFVLLEVNTSMYISGLLDLSSFILEHISRASFSLILPFIY